MTVLLVNTLQPSQSHGSPSSCDSFHDHGNAQDHGNTQGHDDFHGCLPSHFPYISFPEGSLLSNVEDQDRLVGDSVSRYWVRFFHWQDLCVVRSVEPCMGLEIADGRRPGSAEPQIDTDEEDDFSWLAEMHKIDPELGEVDPSCLLPDPPRNRVIGRVRIDSGRIFTDELAGPSPDQILLWEFKTPDGLVSPLCQALASKIVWTTDFEGPTLTLRLTRFGPGPYTEIELQPENGAEELHIFVANLPAEGILGVSGGTYTVEGALSHFPLLSRLAKKQSSRIYIPSVVPEPGVDSGGFVRGGTTLCIGGTFTG